MSMFLSNVELLSTMREQNCTKKTVVGPLTFQPSDAFCG